MPWEINKGVSSDTPSSVIDTEVKEESTPSGPMPWEINTTKAVEPVVEPATSPWEANKVEKPSMSMDSMSLAGYLKGTEQVESPFSSKPMQDANVPTDPTQPSLDLISPRNKVVEDDINAQQKRIVEDVQAKTELLYNRYSTMGNTIKGVWSPEARKEAEDAIQFVRDKKLEELRARGIPVEYRNGKLITIGEDGSEIEVEDTGILRSMYDAKNEIGFAIAGGYLGAKTGAAVGTGVVPGPGTAIGGALGGLIGSATGAYVGSGIDAIFADLDMVIKAEEGVLLDKMVDAGVFDVVAAPLGLVVGKAAVGTGKGLKRAYDYIYSGNIKGAEDALMTHLGVKPEQAKEAVAKLEALVGPLRGLNDSEKAIYALSMTTRGGEGVLGAAAQLDPKASTTIANMVSKRAEDTLALSNELKADNVSYIIKDNLDKYTTEVKRYYNDVKVAPSEFTQDYRFDFDKLGIQPIVDSIGAKIENPTIKQRFINTLTKIEEASEGRTFQDLIDLRQAVNDMKFNGSKVKFSDGKALDEVISTIDSEIESAAKTHIPSYDTWMKSWQNAKVEYAKMKDTEQSVLYKALTAPGITEDRVVNALTKYIGAEDDTFYRVIDKLPKNVRDRVEGTVLDNIVNKFTDGLEGGRRATHFPALAKELQKASWQSPKAKQVVRTINRMADVFKNDLHLAAVSGKINLPKFQSYLTTDPIMRMKYEAASHLFNFAKQLVPGDKADSLALATHAGKLLENPISEVSTRDLMRAMPKDKRVFREKLDFDNTLQELRQEYVYRQQALKQMFNKDVPPRLAWHASPEKLSKLQNPDATILRPIDEVLYGTNRGTVGTNPSEIVLAERTSDYITEYLWRNTTNPQKDITAEAIKYMDDRRYEGIMTNTAKKLAKDDFENNAKIVANSIKSEAGILIKRIEKDFGVKMPKEQAKKIVALKYKEVMEACNGK